MARNKTQMQIKKDEIQQKPASHVTRMTLRIGDMEVTFN